MSRGRDCYWPKEAGAGEDRVALLRWLSQPRAALADLHALLGRFGIDAQVRLVAVESEDAAQRKRFLGSPTLRVEGRDVEPGAEARTDFGLSCRLYPTSSGPPGVPPEQWVAAALLAGRG